MSLLTGRELISIAALPDGMTVDATGKIWVALFGGGCIVQIDPETQTELMTVEVPALCPTSVVFGGTSLTIFGFSRSQPIFLNGRY